MGKIEPLRQSKVGDAGCAAANNRLFVEAVLRIVHAGSLQRDLPASSGNWSSARKRCRCRVLADQFTPIFKILCGNAGMEYAGIGRTIIKVRCHNRDAKGRLRIRQPANPNAKLGLR